MSCRNITLILLIFLSLPSAALASEADDSVAALTALRSELELMKVQAAIEEQRARIKTLQSEQLEQITVPNALGSPGVIAPALPAPPAQMQLPHEAPGKTEIISIQSVDGQFSAMALDENSKERLLRVGDQIDGGRVERITQKEVILRHKNKSTVLRVE